MKSYFVGAVFVGLLLVGCASSSQSQKSQTQTIYDKPLTSPGAKFGALPPLVQRTVLAEAGLAEVVDTKRDTSSGSVIYKIYFRDKANFPPMYVAADGSVLNPNLTVAVSAIHGLRVPPSEVPPPVMKAIPEHAPGAEVDYINKELWGSRVVYVVTFKDQTHNPKLLLAADGTVMEETQ